MREHIVDWIEGCAGGQLIMMGGALALYRRVD